MQSEAAASQFSSLQGGKCSCTGQCAPCAPTQHNQSRGALIEFPPSFLLPFYPVSNIPFHHIPVHFLYLAIYPDKSSYSLRSAVKLFQWGRSKQSPDKNSFLLHFEVKVTHIANHLV